MGFLNELKGKAEGLGHKAKDGLDAARHKAADLVDDAKDKASEIIGDVKGKVDGGGASSPDKYDEALADAEAKAPAQGTDEQNPGRATTFPV